MTPKPSGSIKTPRFGLNAPSRHTPRDGDDDLEVQGTEQRSSRRQLLFGRLRGVSTRPSAELVELLPRGSFSAGYHGIFQKNPRTGRGIRGEQVPGKNPDRPTLEDTRHMRVPSRSTFFQLLRRSNARAAYGCFTGANYISTIEKSNSYKVDLAPCCTMSICRQFVTCVQHQLLGGALRRTAASRARTLANRRPRARSVTPTGLLWTHPPNLRNSRGCHDEYLHTMVRGTDIEQSLRF